MIQQSRVMTIPAIMQVRHRAPAAAVAALTPTSGMAAWWKADAITGLSDGADLTSWPDSSGNGKTATWSANVSGTAIAKPTYRISVVNALPVVRFTRITNQASLVFPPISTIRTVFWVLYETTVALHFWLGGESTYHFHRGSSGEYCLNNVNNLMKNAELRNNQVAVTNNLTEKPSAAVWYQLSMRSTANMTAGRITQDRDIVARSWEGDIAEIIIYTSELSDADRLQTENYLKAKYAL